MNTITKKDETNGTEKKYCVMCQKWEESERGWGTRPDGYSLHLSINELKSYIESYWNSMPDKIPDEYSYPSGTPYECYVSEEIFLGVKNGKNKSHSNDYPAGDSDGWMKIEN